MSHYKERLLCTNIRKEIELVEGFHSNIVKVNNIIDYENPVMQTKSDSFLLPSYIA